MPSLLNLACSLATPIIPVTGQPRLVYLLMEVGGGEGTPGLPVNLGFIIDTSDSMRIRLVTDEQFADLAQYGQTKEIMTDGVPAYQITTIPDELVRKFPRRIDYVSQSLENACEYLRPHDRFSLVAFAERAVAVIPASSGREKARLCQAAGELEYLNLGDSTNMAAGLGLAYDEIQRFRDQPYASRLILLTDGHTRHVSDCYGWAKRARETGLTLTTMGIGSEFNEDLLIPLADMTGGNAYYIESAEQIPEAFRKELGAALGVSYRNVEVKLALAAGVELRRAHRVFPELGEFDIGPNMDGGYGLLLGNYDPATPLGLLLELIVPGWGAGVYRLAQALLAWDDPQGEGSRLHQRQDITIQMAQSISIPFNERVMNIVEKVGAFKFGTQALEAAKGVDKGAATQRLRQAATRLLEMGEAELAQAMLQQAESIEHGREVDPNSTKKLRYETRRLTRRLTD